MGMLIDERSIEAAIADCCRALYHARDGEEAMRIWRKLRALKATRAEELQRQFMRETLVRGESADGKPVRLS